MPPCPPSILAKNAQKPNLHAPQKYSILAPRILCYTASVPITWTGNRRRFVGSGTVRLSAVFTAAEMLISVQCHRIMVLCAAIDIQSIVDITRR